MNQSNADSKLENFDDVWSLGYPAKIEEEFRELLPQAKALPDKSIYLQILSQLALAQALLKKFDEAHKTLDNAEALLTPDYELARVRILLERGRVFQQAGKITEAQDYFERSFELSAKNKLDFHTVNAAHMIAIVAQKEEDKITWNQRAIDLAMSAKDKRARDWLGSLYNNLGQNYLSKQQFEKALEAFLKALEYRNKEGHVPNIRVAKWSVARALRSLNRVDEALALQLKLLKEYDALTESDNYDMPIDMFKLARGWIYEELAEIYQTKTKAFARLAYDDLSNDAMFREVAPKRVDRLKQLKE